MPLVPGPFRLQTEDQLGFANVGYDFTDDAVTAFDSIDGVTAAMDPAISDWELLAADAADLLQGVDLDVILGNAGTQGDLATLPSIDDVVTSLSIGDSQLAAAVAFAPAAAWTDPVQPYVPPDTSVLLIAPEIPPGSYNPSSTGSVGTSGVASIYTVQIFNRTALGSNNFTVGDTVEVFANGRPGDDVTVYAQLNGQDLPPNTIGYIGADGTLDWTATIDPDAVGGWHEDWWVGGNYALTFNFIVAPGS
jgi:hypothetical protein